MKKAAAVVTNQDVRAALNGSESMSPAFHGTFSEAVRQAKAWAREQGHPALWICP